VDEERVDPSTQDKVAPELPEEPRVATGTSEAAQGSGFTLDDPIPEVHVGMPVHVVANSVCNAAIVVDRQERGVIRALVFERKFEQKWMATGYQADGKSGWHAIPLCPTGE